MDHMMPEMDGIEATEKIREIGTDYAKNIPIIALTANAIVGNEKMFLDKGFNAFLTKPIDLMRLDAVIRQWVRDKNREDKSLEEEFPIGIEEQPISDVPSQVVSWQIDGIDLHKGLKHFGDDEESLLQVLRSYTANTRLLLDVIRGVTPDKLADYAITVHGIKGSSRSICASLAGDKAEALEKASKAGDFDFVNKNNLELIEIVEKLLTDLDNMLSTIDSEKQKPIKDRPDTGVLNKLLEACKIYDMDSVDEAVKELECYEYKSGGELVAWLWENVQQFNINEIIDKLSTLTV
jgi:CheY-like chemotaxis protein